MEANITKLFSSFEEIKQIKDNLEFWSARDLQGLLGYQTWQKFEEAIGRAMESCKKAGNMIEDHFLPESVKSTGGRPGLDYRLSRYACYLIAQNGDPRKQEIAFAQAYKE